MKRIALKLAIKNYILVLQGTSLYVNDGLLDTLSRLSQYLSRISAQFSGALGCTSVLGKHLRCEKNKDYLLGSLSLSFQSTRWEFFDPLGKYVSTYKWLFNIASQGLFRILSKFKPHLLPKFNHDQSIHFSESLVLWYFFCNFQGKK